MHAVHPKLNPYRVGFVFIALAVLATVVLIPFAVLSIFDNIGKPYEARAYKLISPKQIGTEDTTLNVDAQSINEVDDTMTLRISGYHRCFPTCAVQEQVRLFSLQANPIGAEGAPPSVAVTLPVDASEIDTDVTLPVAGELASYPFDHYNLDLGVILYTVNGGGAQRPLPMAHARSQLSFSVGEDIPRLSMDTPLTQPPGRYFGSTVTYDYVVQLRFFRPQYLRLLTVLLVTFITLSAVYAVMLRTFRDIIGTTGVIVLGVWGVRSLLVGNYPPDSTAVDLVLSGVILLLLFVIALRGLIYIWPRSFGHQDADSGGADGTGSSRGSGD